MAKFLDLCSGIGAFRMAAERLGHECVGYAELDKFARKSYEAIYDTTDEWTAWDLRDVTNEEWSELKGQVDLITGGFPCLRGDEKIFTDRGLLEIKDIQLGDKVLTHKGNFKPVERRVVNPFKGDYYTFKTQYHSKRWGCTHNHKLLGVKTVSPCWRNRGGSCIESCRQQEKTIKEKSKDGEKVYSWISPCNKPYQDYKVEWIEAKDLEVGDYIAYPINNHINGLDTIKAQYSELPLEDELFWEVIGLWVADGHRYQNGKHYTVGWSVNQKEEHLLEKIKQLAELLDRSIFIEKRKGCYVAAIQHKLLCEFVSEYYNINKEKQFPLYCEELEDKYKTKLINGYWLGDGCYLDNGKVNSFQITSTSLPLLNQVQRMLYKFRLVSSIQLAYKGGKAEIQGRSVNTKDCYTLKVNGVDAELFNNLIANIEIKPYKTKQHTSCWFDENYFYVRITERTKEVESFDVYNLTVTDDHSYVGVGLTMYKNCQAFSVAGKGKGFDDIRGTVFFEVARAIEQVSPQMFILENVKNLISHDKGNTIDTVIRTLNEIGYTVDYTILNSKYYDVPHSRDRVFIVGVKDQPTEDWIIEGTNVLAKSKRRIAAYSWSKTFNFNFPDSDIIRYQLMDILEPEEDVPPHLYLSPEKTKALIQGILERDERLGRTDAIRMLGLLNMKGLQSTRRVYDPQGLAPTLTTMSGGNTEPKILVAGNVNPSEKGMGGQVYHAESGLSPTINAGHEGGKHIVYPTKTSYCPILNPDKLEVKQNGRRLKSDGEEMFTLTAQDRHGVLMYQLPRGYNAGELHEMAPTLSSNSYKENNLLIKDNYVVRKLTPKECWRLQAFPDWAYDKAAEVNSASQLYKQAGNSLTVNVAYEIFKRLLP